MRRPMIRGLGPRRPQPAPVRCGDGRHALRTGRLVLHTPRDFLDVEMGAAAGADADAQRWFGWIPDSIVTPETATHLLGIHDGNRAERLRAFPKAVRRELIQPVVLPGPAEEQRLLAVDPATGLVAGMSSLTPDRHGAIGIWLAPAFRGRGLGTELVAATARFGHEHLGLDSVRAGTESSNHRCRGALSAAGFVPDDGPALHTLPDGRVVDSAWYRHEAAGTARCPAVPEGAVIRA
ncbi:GNAT family N-acetyltransferase [Streptomyces xanthophaeus]|uniref:GNAT family N-acetyltransferase n=1 Tax=Streptomyces xanthophaeus TaxID=67385 RepID=UPI002647E207|nr:GNAT family N-acetyltransferase [Streptomyces xanthophaeus]WKD36715.1 GNAT family N-acetyltransferase [Streptomyces xanthophaeus]